ncbi:MAG: DUF3108 domain-containing protein [Gammaproteobacteria bacterium]|nr:DUF3108 domain-containing protein [Gammaproteobacteria bacterium]
MTRRYTIADSLSSDKENLTVDFDWSLVIATGRLNDTDIELPLRHKPAKTLDRLSFQIAVINDLNNDRLRDKYQFIDGDRIKTYHTQKVGTETLRIKSKNYETIKLKHQRPGSSRANYVWHAPNLNYLPVRIEQTKRGKVESRADLTKYSFYQ